MSNRSLLRQRTEQNGVQPDATQTQAQAQAAQPQAQESYLQQRADQALIQDPKAAADYAALRDRVRDQLLLEISGDLLLRPNDASLAMVARQKLHQNLERDGTVPAAFRESMVTRLVRDLVGFGPIQPLIDDADVTEILVNRYDDIWVEKAGRLFKVGHIYHFENDRAVRHLAERVALPLRRRIDERHPILDARLPDGSRVCATLAPPALNGSAIAIRKFNPRMLGLDSLIETGTVTEEVRAFLERAVRARCNLLVSGGTSSGKTTILNALSRFIPNDERVITIEDAAELQLQQPHVLRYETRHGNAEGQGEITIRDLVRTSLRLRPDRIIVGEVRGAEALDMIQACNTGHDGGFSTLHANSARDALSRLETMVLIADSGLPLRAIRQQIASAFELVVQCVRLKNGKRRIADVAEVDLSEDGDYALRSIFRLNHGTDLLEATGTAPRRVNQRYLWGN